MGAEMNAARKAVRSLANFRIGRQTLYIVPIRGIAYAAVSAAIVFLIMLLLDRWVLGSLEAGVWTAAEQWSRHNKRVEENHRRKTTTNECQIREWNGQPASAGQGRRKILVMGDSFLWGPPYVTLNHLWWRQLAIELERRGYRDVEVLAAGHPGWSTHRQLDCAKQLIPEIKPDLVIWGYVTNDPDEKIVRQIFDSQDRPPYGQRIRNQLKRFLPNMTFKFESLRADKLAIQYAGPKYGYTYPEWELNLLQGENFERYQQTVADVSAVMRQANVPTFLLTLPHFPNREYFEPRYASALALWQEAGSPVRNTVVDFVERYVNAPASGPEALQWGINPADSHPGPKATHFHAVMAADFIEKTWPNLLGSKDLTHPHDLVINDWLPFDLNAHQIGENRFEVEYPTTRDFMFHPPGEPATALVALRFPLPLESIRLNGAGLTSAQMWISMLHPGDPYDEVEWHELKQGEEGALKVPAGLASRSVAEIRFRCDITGGDRRLQLTLVRLTDPTERP